MMQILRYYATKVTFTRDFYPSSSVRIFRKSKITNASIPKPPSKSSTKTSTISQKEQNEEGLRNPLSQEEKHIIEDNEYYANLVKVQMLSRNLHKQIFPHIKRFAPEEKTQKTHNLIADLRRHGIDIDSTECIKDVLLQLPKLHGDNIEDHFHTIAQQQVEPYKQLLLPLVECKHLPTKPKKWAYIAGWTAYDPASGKPISVAYPEENGLIFDVEVCVSAGSAPILATAVSTTRWYSWVSPKLLSENSQNPLQQRQHYKLDNLIPMGKENPKIIVGHNVSYDRARLREQYLIDDTGTRFLDTMSLHVSVSGITSYQRALLKSKKEPAAEDLDWQSQSSLNSLVEVHRLYCGGEPLSKEPRNIFVEGTLQDVRDNFQSLTSYCAGDVEATQRVLHKVYPMFAERFPHPVTLAGMLEMGSAYLPVNSNWERYIREADLTYEDLSIEAKYHLGRRADEACALLNNEQYRQHLWLWDEDWSTQKLKMKQDKRPKKLTGNEQGSQTQLSSSKNDSSEEQRLKQKFQHLYDKQDSLPVRRPLLPGYPNWYRKLCVKPPRGRVAQDNSWAPGATEIGTGMQIAPKLLALCWEGYPLHYNREHGWGFLVPFRTTHSTDNLNSDHVRIPIEVLAARCPIPEFARMCASESESDVAFDSLPKELEKNLGKREFYRKKTSKKSDPTQGQYTGSGVWCNHVIDDCCFFLRLPHKNGKSFRVGNPLSKDFLNKFSENVLSSGDVESNSAARVIEIARMMSYWRNNRDRILGQMVVWLDNHELPLELRPQADAIDYGAICPQVVTCGTLTRRAMEPTWMTASNSRSDRIGSELRAMVQAPPNYKIVGADVDSQELWIASVLGDAYACKEHGATPFGWMTLSGTKSNGTDMHSITAKAVGISRDHAKVINYARIYGAGQNFAEDLLKQFNPTFSTTEAKSKAMKMFAITKGKRSYRLREEFHDESPDQDYTAYEATKMAMQRNRPVNEIFHRPSWQGGTESAMFNRLEEIASGAHPVTPFLGCRLSRALETNDDNRYLPTRVNWVVQSGAVDFLHLMLVSMRWLMGSHIRFCLSFHDEVRYLVKDEMAYKTALAMHITNLLTRSFCASRIGLNDLPMSVAFFSSVEVDTVLRKECTMDCKTPSNLHGLHIGYGIPPGESLNIYDAIEKAEGNDLQKWTWIK